MSPPSVFPGGRDVFRIRKSFVFSAAHHLPYLAAGHKCARQHGHNYTVELIVEAGELIAPGFVTDFADLAPLGAYIEAHLDHADLNEVLEVPTTAENLARHLAGWCIENLQPHIDGRIAAVCVGETARCFAEVWLAPR